MSTREPAAASEPDPAAGHILVLADGGWRMIERDGPAPAVDTTVDVDGDAYVVTRVGRPSLPADGRARVYLEPERSV